MHDRILPRCEPLVKQATLRHGKWLEHVAVVCGMHTQLLVVVYVSYVGRSTHERDVLAPCITCRATHACFSATYAQFKAMALSTQANDRVSELYERVRLMTAGEKALREVRARAADGAEAAAAAQQCTPLVTWHDTTA
jgi:hypothetical protein